MNGKILMIAYACNPEGSGEHWLGWGWAEQAAKNFQVHLITTPNAKDAVEKHAKRCGITVHFVAVPEWFKKFSSNFGSGGTWSRKILWQRRVAKLARELHQREKFSVVHQTTFHTFRVPFDSAGLGIPSVWGPIAGGETVPRGFHKFLGAAKWPELIRNSINKFWLLWPAVRQSLRRAHVIFLSNKSSRDFFPAEFHHKFQIVPANTIRPGENAVQQRIRSREGTFQLLYVGNCVATRAIPIVFYALLESKLANVNLSIIGKGPAIPFWKKLSKKLGLENKVRFLGQMPFAKLQEYYLSSDVLVFPALRDSGGSALLEAMEKQLPVVCLNWGGPGEIVDDQCGFKIPVKNPDETIRQMAASLVALEKNPEHCRELGKHGAERAKNFSWENKRQLLEETYIDLQNR
jgi:glycosyltransferase involved in cell wall biosynthesis